MADTNEAPDIVQQAARRQAGIAALRKLRRMVDEDKAQTRCKARWAERLGILFLLLAVAVIAWVMGRAPH